MSTVQSIERAFSILDVIAAESNGISVTETSKRVQLPTSTVSRLILTLEQLGAVERLENERVRIGKRIFGLTANLTQEEQLIAAAQPHLKDLAESIGEDAALVTPEGFDAKFIAQASGGQTIQVQDWTGSKFPMHTLTAGKLFLAYEKEQMLKRYLSRPLEAFTTRTVTNTKSLKSQLEQIREDGFCWSFSEFADDLNAVSTPILINADTVIATITIYGPAYRFPNKKEKAITKQLLSKSKAIGKQLELHQKV